MAKLTGESFNKNLSATCVCPKACDNVLYKAFMSYAASKQNSENRIDLPEDVLRRVGKHLNESLDTREYIETDKRIVNIQEAERVLRYLPPEHMVIRDELLQFYNSIFAMSFELWRDCYNLPTFLETLGFKNMKKVLENDFIAGWKRMNFYDRVVPEYVLLIETLIDSIDTIDQKQWRGVLLKLQLDLLKRTLYNLDRVHAAYHNAVPLVNNKVTPNGSYDAIYLTKELFIHTPEINETYTRLIGHIRKYKEHIDRMFRTNITNCHMTETRNKCISHSNGFWRVSADYERDLRLYESLVIKQPLHRLNGEIEKWESLHVRGPIESFILASVTHLYKLNASIREMVMSSSAYHDTNMTDTIKMYLDDLRKGKRVSKLLIAGKLYTYKVVQLIDNFIQIFLTNRYYRSVIMLDKFNIERTLCALPRALKQLPLLRAWYLKIPHYFNITTDADKSDMEDYFKIKNHNSPQARMVRDEAVVSSCDHQPLRHFPSSINVSSRQITSYKKTLDTLLHKTQLDGTLFRYVNFTFTLTLVFYDLFILFHSSLYYAAIVSYTILLMKLYYYFINLLFTYLFIL